MCTLIYIFFYQNGGVFPQKYPMMHFDAQSLSPGGSLFLQSMDVNISFVCNIKIEQLN